MATMTSLQVPFDGWTVDDLPDDVDFRYELVDGSLLVSPPPELRHQEVAAELLLLLRPVLPQRWRAVLTPGVHFDQRNYREPDVVVYQRSASVKNKIEPADVVLAVEVMSPSSVSNDRVSKPAQYATAGIAHYWRLELDPLVLVTHVLDGDVYREAGRFTDEADIDEPVDLRFSLADLLA